MALAVPTAIERLPCALPSIFLHLDNGSANFNNVDKTNIDEVRAVIEDFNKVAAPYAKLVRCFLFGVFVHVSPVGIKTGFHLLQWKGQTNPAFESWSQDRADVDLLTIICSLSFSRQDPLLRRSIFIIYPFRAVSNPQLLNNHYAPFSSGVLRFLYTDHVYGETSYEQMQSIIDQIGFREQDVFLDLGCGVGQLVMYVAGGTKVKKSVGIEINDLPAKYGAAMGEDFSKWMKWWKKKCRPFQLIHGDMLDEQYRTLITQEATIIFINNYAFEPSLDLHIKNMLADCHMGTRIISTKAYATGTKRVNMRNLGDVESIMEVSQLKTVKQPTSWTPNTVPYYLHTVSHYKERNRLQQTRNNDSVKTEDADDSNGDSDSKAFVLTYNGSPMPGSPRWNDADTDYVPPGVKKPRKSHHMGCTSSHKSESSKKSAVRSRPAVRVSEDAREGIEKMHALISTPRPVDTNVGEGLVRVDLPHSSNRNEKLYSEGEELNDGRSVVRIIDKETEFVMSLKSPLDAYCLSVRDLLNTLSEYMNTPSFRQEVEDNITLEKARNAELVEKVRQMQAAVAAQRAQGVCALYERLNDLGMSDVETPTELLQGSKQIVAQHKVLNQPQGDNPFNVEELLQSVMSQMGNDNTSTALRLESENEGVEGLLMSPVGGPSTIGPIHVASSSRRPRQRPRAGPGARGKGKPEENSEEMQRQINEIVQAALKVDSAAKEKERRSRGTERPARRSAALHVNTDSVVVPLQRSAQFPMASRRDDPELDVVATNISTSCAQPPFTSATVAPSAGNV
ncbi:unnamed protein product [Angiostrongylus costaricensis]|uniref:Histone-lysine N-methyltransferase, H3 lysine-79 specific n=1 Tax=Angiostrongylus costaricensis TaxID=334426 RepID=A0A0R3PQL4_ANGCS|nr:unnamed protein product [Angiostrongylus costaricensis]